MQALTAPPRGGLSPAQVLAVLQADALTVGYGLEQLDPVTGAVTGDLSSDLAGGQIDRDCWAETTHGSCTLTLTSALPPAARVRPYMTLSGAGVLGARWNLGVFILTTPDRDVSTTPVRYTVTGYDRLYLLAQPIGTSWGYRAGANVLASVQDVLAASGAGGQVVVDPTAAAATLTADKTWPLDETNQTTYSQAANELLASVNYRPVWADQDGAYHLDAWVPGLARPVEWAHTAADPTTSLIATGRKVAGDTFAVPNWWRGTARAWPTAPTEGAGQYTYADDSGGPNSVATVAVRKKSLLWFDAADQASLVAQVRRQVATDTQLLRTLSVQTAPMPNVGHLDVYSYLDPQLPDVTRVQGRTWSLPLDGSLMTHTWDVLT